MGGQAALVTGSSRGIGLAAAVELARAGFAVAVNGPAEDAELAGAVEMVRAEGGAVVATAFDVADVGAHAAALERIEAEIGPLTTLVNNAGVGVMSRGDVLDVTPESWDRCMAVNARGAFFLTQAFARRLLGRAREAGLFHSVVNVTSANASAVAVQRGEYCASKAAAAMGSSVFAVRLGAEGIAVYDVRPGLIETEMTAPVIESYRARAADGLDADAARGRAGGGRAGDRDAGGRRAALHDGAGGGGRRRDARAAVLRRGADRAGSPRGRRGLRGDEARFPRTGLWKLSFTRPSATTCFQPRRGTSRPAAFATSLPSSITGVPRRMTVSGQPVTSIPS